MHRLPSGYLQNICWNIRPSALILQWKELQLYSLHKPEALSPLCWTDDGTQRGLGEIRLGAPLGNPCSILYTPKYSRIMGIMGYAWCSKWGKDPRTSFSVGGFVLFLFLCQHWSIRKSRHLYTLYMLWTISLTDCGWTGATQKFKNVLRGLKL